MGKRLRWLWVLVTAVFVCAGSVVTARGREARMPGFAATPNAAAFLKEPVSGGVTWSGFCWHASLMDATLLGQGSTQAAWLTSQEREHEYVGQGYTVTFVLDQQWDVAYTARVIVRNTGDKTVDDWCLDLPLDSDITNIWNADVVRREDGTYRIKNKGWNQDVPVGGSVEFGFEARGQFPGFPAACEIVGERVSVNPADYEVTYSLRSDWGTGFDGILTLRNRSNKAIEDWTLSLEFDNEISNIWGASIADRKGMRYELTCPDYRQNINPGEVVEIGFTVQSGTSKHRASVAGMTMMDTDASPSAPVAVKIDSSVFTKLAVGDDGREAYFAGPMDEIPGTLKGADDVRDLRYVVERDGRAVSSGSVDVAESWKIRGFRFAWGENRIRVTATDVHGRERTDSIDVYNIDPTNMGDLVNDPDEQGYMFTHDTDGDTLPDLMEIELTITNPFKVDTSGDGVSDADEDRDNDGLTNGQEARLGTDPASADTDDDGLSDVAEANRHHTDPLSEDTDGDGAGDAWELEHGFDPLVHDDSFTITTKLEVSDKIRDMSLTITGDGKAAEHLCVEPIRTVPFGEEMPGYLGDCHEFSTDGSLDSATVSYTLDESLFSNPDFKPRLYRFNEETQLLEEVEGQFLEGNVLTAKLSHFSKYVVRDAIKSDDRLWGFGLEYDDGQGPEYGKLDVAFVIDSSGSMSWNDSKGVRKDVTNVFIDKLTEHDRAAVIGFDHSAELLAPLGSDKGTLHAAVARIDSSGGTSISVAMSAAIDMFTSPDYDGDGRARYIVLLTDGDGDYDDAYTQVAKQNGIVVYTVGLGDHVSEALLRRIAEGTGGEYYHASEADKLTGIFDAIYNWMDLYKDSDSDGLSDYYEKQMARGNLRLGSDIPLTGISYLNSDSDGDGLKDGEEITIRSEWMQQAGTTPSRYIYAFLRSDPTKEDTDGDGMHDGRPRATRGVEVVPKDPEPLHVNFRDMPGIWDRQYDEAEAGNFATELGEWDKYSISWDMLKELLGLNSPADFIKTEIAVRGGSEFLNFKLDNKGKAIHSQVETWQKFWGYNDLYDVVFHVGTQGRMSKKKFPFPMGEEEYIVWAWQGYYINLGSGSEIGMYRRVVSTPEDIFGWKATSLEHWAAIDFELPMTLGLYNHRAAGDIDTVFCWAPSAWQWWITGFNPDFSEVVVTDMVSVGSMDLSGRIGMYEALKGKVQGEPSLRDLMVFDDKSRKAWLVWRGEEDQLW